MLYMPFWWGFIRAFDVGIFHLLINMEHIPWAHARIKDLRRASDVPHDHAAE